MKSICICGKPIHPMRTELGFDNCIDCANANPVEPPKGRMVYDGKVGAQIEIMSAETWRDNKGYFIPKGGRSCVKNFSKNVSA